MRFSGLKSPRNLHNSAGSIRVASHCAFAVRLVTSSEHGSCSMVNLDVSLGSNAGGVGAGFAVFAGDFAGRWG